MNVRRVKCCKCEHVVESGRGVRGCGCDPDAPTWIALAGAALLTGSHSKWEELTEGNTP